MSKEPSHILALSAWTRPEGAEHKPFDAELAASMEGKYVLIGITYLNSAGQATERQQTHGEIQRVSQEEGFVIVRADGSIIRLPPDLEQMETAKPGEYRMRATGEIVSDPDFVCAVRVTMPESQGN